ncbi:MFS transporter [Halobacillus kuroshimensis]|uniref:MFS transporter n=1 Tax=Halobacillus kuroshimensis TaxID=302481 RepID=UPI00040636A6|nr:MFS transporter [Halobacillus kuroshimensis]
MYQGAWVIPRLSTMMFLQYFVLGSWFATIGLILSRHGLGSIVGAAFSVGGIAAIISPIILGMVTDRFFSSQKVLGVINLVGAVVLWTMPQHIYSGNASVFLLLMFCYMLCFNPTYSLTNNISFQNIKDTTKKFPLIRVCGTIGFITAGLLIGILGYSDSPVSIQIGGAVSAFLGFYSFTLPHTPPLAKGKPLSLRDIFCIDAFSLLKNKYFLLFILGTVILFIPKAAYQSYASVLLGTLKVDSVASVLTIGQVSEVLFLLLMPLFFRRLGFKYMFIIGISAHMLRNLLFSFGAAETFIPLVLAGIALHGLCWDFFFVSGYIYTEKKAGEEMKSQAQGMLIMFTQGIGMFIGGAVSGVLYNNTVTREGPEALSQWSTFWIYPSMIALVVALVFLFFFNDREADDTQASEEELNKERVSI